MGRQSLLFEAPPQPAPVDDSRTRDLRVDWLCRGAAHKRHRGGTGRDDRRPGQPSKRGQRHLPPDEALRQAAPRAVMKNKRVAVLAALALLVALRSFHVELPHRHPRRPHSWRRPRDWHRP